jgi:hypothetical protein
MQAPDVDNVILAGHLEGGRRRADRGNIKGVIDGFQLCRLDGELFDQVLPDGAGDADDIAPW